jgi:hypothetical protein
MLKKITLNNFCNIADTLRHTAWPENYYYE